MFDEIDQFNEHQEKAQEFQGVGIIGNFSIEEDDFETSGDSSIPDVIRGHGSHSSHSSK